jgi:tetratricopeptide (TPR) repeat protein
VESDLARAVERLERAVTRDSAAGFSAARACRACEALAALADRYDWADSTEAVQRTLTRWSTLRPTDYQPWQRRADHMVSLGRERDADQALHRADSLGAPRRASVIDTLVRSLRGDDLETANRLCSNRLGGLDVAAFVSLRSHCTIALRAQGRYRDAIGLVRGGRFPGARAGRTEVPRDSLHEAILDMEMARPAAAAMQFAAMARDASGRSHPDGAKARLMTWRLTLSGTAAALFTDTVRVRALADSVDLIGHRSLSLTEPLLHHFLRGVLLASGNHHEAAVRELRAAIASPANGYTRANYELARSLLALARPAEAIPVLRAALRGRIHEPGLYLTRTETHELLARAFLEIGATDSATSHYAVVERAWRGADPMFAQRYAVAQRWMAQHRH